MQNSFYSKAALIGRIEFKGIQNRSEPHGLLQCEEIHSKNPILQTAAIAVKGRPPQIDKR